VTNSSVLPARVVVISDGHGFARLVRTLLDDLTLMVRTNTVAQSAVIFVEELQPALVILDLIPGHETACWLVLEALKARPSTRTIPVLLCPAAPWLIDGHQERLALHGVRVWCDAFDLRDLLGQIEAALGEQAGVPAMP
jgi:CheY-like chemotaxis protein